MNSIFHTEAPEKVRTLPEKAPRKHYHGLLREIICVVLFLGLLALLTLGCIDIYKNPAEHYPLYKVNQPEVDAPADQPEIVLQAVTNLAANNGTVGDQVPGALTVVASNSAGTLTNRDFIYYYWDAFYSMYSQMGSYLSSMLSFDTPFDQQMIMEGQTWHQYLSGNAVNAWHQTELLYQAALKDGHQLSADEEAYLASATQSMDDFAKQSGFVDAENYLHSIFDPSADLESYIAYNRRNIMARSYADASYQKFYDQVFDPNAPVQYCIDVRHILLQPNEGEEMSSVLTRAEALLELWGNDPTEENFAALAAERTTDGGSQATGGLYEDVYPGQMVSTFNDWCFDESRQPGDTGIVESEYGYHIMYFVGDSETVYSDGNEEAAQEAYTAWLDDLFASDTVQDLSANAVFTAKAK